ncbi:MAG: HAD hydrolase-like protein [Proteobacteria bacterium]|nr:HAD hydrolase-like protein [Pseudomonadota bacterium]
MQKIKPFLQGKKHIIWDWNGTLLDDLETAVNAMKKMLDGRGLPSLDVGKYRTIFGFPIKAYYEKLGLDTRDDQLTLLSHEFHQHYDSGFEVCRLHSGVESFLREAKSLQISQSILSAAQQDWLVKQLHHFGIRDYFDHVFGLTDFLAHGKLERGRQLIEITGIDRSETLLIGDTDHDVEVARELGIDVVIYADGHQSPERFTHFDVPVLNRGI